MSNEYEDLISKMSESMKLSPALEEAIKSIGAPMAILPELALPEISSFQRRDFQMPALPSHQDQNYYQSAGVLMEALANEALQWKENLPENYTPAILAILYGGVRIHVNTLSQISFHGIRVEGMIDGAKCSVLAHQSTIQLLCYAQEVNPESPKNPIGFIWDNDKIEI